MIRILPRRVVAGERRTILSESEKSSARKCALYSLANSEIGSYGDAKLDWETECKLCSYLNAKLGRSLAAKGAHFTLAKNPQRSELRYVSGLMG